MIARPSLDRFAQGPEDPQNRPRKLVAHCKSCGEELYEHEDCLYYDGMAFCSEECLAHYISRHVGNVTTATCLICGHEFEPGEKMVIYDGEVFCAPEDDDCVMKYLEMYGLIERRSAGEE